MNIKEEILINVTPRETRVAVIEHGVLQELHLERALSRGLVGNIFKAKVVRVLPGMQAAFVDLGLDKNGFLHAADVVRTDPAFTEQALGETPRIQELVREGEIITTEAMTTIDVNTGSFVGRRNHEDTFFKTNLEAATEIAHQLRLRNSSGIIIVDFIDMQTHRHKKQVLAALESAIAKDRVKIQIADMSPLGLVEITRKRTWESLEQLMCEPCDVCDGRGMVKTAQTVCYEILREVLREDRQYKARAYTIVASTTVINLLLDEEANSLADLQEFIQRQVSLQVDQLYHQQQYDIVLN
ncbi:UNVERIFIED_CONTAM: hypothetical protein GTU68_016277 [Idotea baltica]|nr:hypothetical protein [Idotea baltica]